MAVDAELFPASDYERKVHSTVEVYFSLASGDRRWG